MEIEPDIGTLGLFEARYTAFLATITHLRPRLHRYCARMTGSLSDGEDVMQEALFGAYRKLDSFDDSRALSPWLFRIAHNRCIDFLRRRDVRHKAEMAATEPESIAPNEPPGPSLDRAVERLVIQSSAEGTRVRPAQGRVGLFSGRDRRTGGLYRRRR